MKHTKTIWCCCDLETWKIACANFTDTDNKPRDWLTAKPLTFIKNNKLRYCPFCAEKIEIE